MIFSNISPAALDLHALSSPPKEMALRALGGQSGISLARRTASSLVLPGDVPSDWLRISEMAKEVVGWPAWPEADPSPSGARIVTRRNELHTAAGSTISVVIPLGESGGPGREAVRLRLAAWPFRREYDVTATLEVEGGRTFVTIARVDGWPPDLHINTVARRHGALRHLPPVIEGHHVHRFTDNARLGRGAFAPMANLPIAAPIADRLRSFRDFAHIVENEFNIDGFNRFNKPNWQGLL